MRGEKGLVFIVNARGREGFKQGCGCLSLSNITLVRLESGFQRKQGDGDYRTRPSRARLADSGSRCSGTSEDAFGWCPGVCGKSGGKSVR